MRKLVADFLASSVRPTSALPVVNLAFSPATNLAADPGSLTPIDPMLAGDAEERAMSATATVASSNSAMMMKIAFFIKLKSPSKFFFPPAQYERLLWFVPWHCSEHVP